MNACRDAIKVLTITCLMVCLAACGDKAEAPKPTVNAAQPAPAAGKTAADAAVPNFRKDETYKNVRQRMIRVGWSQYRKPGSDACNGGKCSDFPEMESCDPVRGACKFNWKSGERIATISTLPGAGDEDFFDSVSVGIDEGGKKGGPAADDSFVASAREAPAKSSASAEMQFLANQLGGQRVVDCATITNEAAYQLDVTSDDTASLKRISKAMATAYNQLAESLDASERSSYSSSYSRRHGPVSGPEGMAFLTSCATDSRVSGVAQGDAVSIGKKE
jgi:hypothetical protein